MSIPNLPVKSKGSLSPRPYARLLTMIGDQLIKNEKIALFELIKNSYDADADWVQVRLKSFDTELDDNGNLISISANKNSIIEIEDNGVGMTWHIISEVWMNPASPFKYFEKRKPDIQKTGKRIIQGEKGIGRYATFKIGSTVEIFTRAKEKPAKEIYLKSDLSGYDEELFTKKGDKAENIQYLDEVKYEYEINDEPKEIKDKKITFLNSNKSVKGYGTLIRISNLKSSGLDLERVNEIVNDVNKLGSPFAKEDILSDFSFDLTINGKSIYQKGVFKDKLTGILERAPLKLIDGVFDGDGNFTFSLNKRSISLGLEKLKGYTVFRDRFCDKKDKTIFRPPECGPFEFQFFVFDLGKDAPLKYKIDNNDDDKDFIKSHRIYLYRDGIRVYPYGDPSDDWIRQDIKRGTRRAGDFLSNDQIIGYVAISNELNPKLKDKTNREGLLEIGNAFEDFIALIQTIFGYLHVEFTKYKSAYEEKNVIDSFKKSEVTSQLNLFRDSIADKIGNHEKKEFDSIIRKYNAERKYLIEKADTAEDLAAVGLTVEAASHDLMTMISRAKETMDILLLMGNSKEINQDTLHENLAKLRGEITFIEDQIKGIQPIFKSSRRRKKDHRVLDIIKTVQKYYSIVLSNYKIELIVEEVGTPLVIRTNEAVLLQAFINLLDNSVYWLTTTDSKNKKIQIKIDGNNYHVRFADNGPGISPDDEPYIFEPFFSTRGDKGRGLGLYIARQLLERNGYSINYEKNKKLLSGASFLLDFNEEEEE